MSAHTTPVLTNIFVHTEQLCKHTSEAIRTLAREARMVLSVRLASSLSKPRIPRSSPGESVHTTYQKALKLLQDPILPVRAHGLLLLRQLVAPPRPTSSTSSVPPAEVRPLVPSILDLFLQSVQDDDSYVFLNAVQGLSALVDGFGSEVLRSLV